jgi:hypothetical protein
MGNTFQILVRLDVSNDWQRLGVHGAQASEASRSGVNTKTLCAPVAASGLYSPLRASISASAAHIGDETYPAKVGWPQLSDQQFRKIDQRLAPNAGLQSHQVSNKSFSHKSLSATPFDLSIAAHPSHYPMLWIKHFGLPIPSWSWAIELGWRPLGQRLMGSDLIVGFDPPIRTPLLCPAMTRGRPRRLGLEHPVHLFVPAILFGMPRSNKFDAYPQRRPPGAQTRKAHRSCRSKGMAIVHPNDFRTAVPAEEPPKLPLHRFPTLVLEQTDGQYFAAEQIPDRQGIHSSAILSSKPSLEVRRPNVIAPPRHCQSRPLDGRTATKAPSPGASVQAQSLEPFANGAGRWTPLTGMLSAQPRRQFPAAPASVASSQSPNPPQPLPGNLSRTMLGPPRALAQSTKSIAFETLLPLVSNPAAQAEFPAQNSHAFLGLHGQFHKPKPLHCSRHLYPCHAPKKGPN